MFFEIEKSNLPLEDSLNGVMAFTANVTLRLILANLRLTAKFLAVVRLSDKPLTPSEKKTDDEKKLSRNYNLLKKKLMKC